MISNQFSFVALVHIWSEGHIILWQPEPRILYEYNFLNQLHMGKLSWLCRERGHERALAFLLIFVAAKGRKNNGKILGFNVQLSMDWDVYWTLSVSPSTLVIFFLGENTGESRNERMEKGGGDNAQNCSFWSLEANLPRETGGGKNRAPPKCSLY